MDKISEYREQIRELIELTRSGAIRWEKRSDTIFTLSTIIRDEETGRPIRNQIMLQSTGAPIKHRYRLVLTLGKSQAVDLQSQEILQLEPDLRRLFDVVSDSFMEESVGALESFINQLKTNIDRPN